MVRGRVSHDMLQTLCIHVQTLGLGSGERVVTICYKPDVHIILLFAVGVFIIV